MLLLSDGSSVSIFVSFFVSVHSSILNMFYCAMGLQINSKNDVTQGKMLFSQKQLMWQIFKQNLWTFYCCAKAAENKNKVNKFRWTSSDHLLLFEKTFCSFFCEFFFFINEKLCKMFCHVSFRVISFGWKKEKIKWNMNKARAENKRRAQFGVSLEAQQQQKLHTVISAGARSREEITVGF